MNIPFLTHACNPIMNIDVKNNTKRKCVSRMNILNWRQLHGEHQFNRKNEWLTPSQGQRKSTAIGGAWKFAERYIKEIHILQWGIDKIWTIGKFVLNFLLVYD